MNDIDLFDKYIANELTESEKTSFEERLKCDTDFASDFKTYLLTVDGIHREGKQDDIEFGMAMKKLSKEELRDIIGPHRGPAFPKWFWHVTSIAAVVIVAFTAVFNNDSQACNDVDDAVYYCNKDEITSWRSSGEQMDITRMDDEELTHNLPKMYDSFKNASTDQDMADNGYLLAMAYIRLHDRENAREVLNILIEKFDENEDYMGFVDKCKSVLKLIR